MKKIPLILAALLIVMTVQSQTIIPKTGLVRSSVSTENTDGYKGQVGLTTGVGLNLKIGNVFSLQPELNFIQKGYRQEQNDFVFDAKINVSISYLEVPILAKVMFGDKFKFFLNAGPAIGLGLGGAYNVKFDGESIDGHIRFGDQDRSNGETAYMDHRMDISLQYGCGVVIADLIMIDIRRGVSLTNLTDDGDVFDEMSNRTYQLTVAVPIRLKKD
jgi:hypothetical protein